MFKWILLSFVLLPVIAAGEESGTKFCGCPTPWVVLDGPAAGVPRNLVQIYSVDEAELMAFADYNRLTCTFHDRFYPGFCHGVFFGNNTVGTLIRRNPYYKSSDKTEKLIDDVVSVVVEEEFGSGLRLASLVTKASNVRCSGAPADGRMIQSYTRLVIEADWDQRGRCAISSPLARR